MFNGKSILITGGTGSFGRKFVRTLFQRYKPRRVVVYSRDEVKQYEMQQDFPQEEMRFFLGDVRDLPRLQQAMEGVDYLVHAAALKQVPAAEYNPMECVKTNVLGAWNVVTASIENNVEKVIALSTDKAVTPVNLYGATKLCADKLFVAGNNIVGKAQTRFSVTRYGNVVGSRGSVVPLFRALASNGTRELPITDPRMTRFWITLQQAVDFTLTNFSRMQGGEIFVPKIPSMRILDLAESIGPGMEHKIIGIRPGEKVHEVLCPADDSHRTLEFETHYVLQPSISFAAAVDYTRNRLGETGKPVEVGFSYCSATNPHFLTVRELASMEME